MTPSSPALLLLADGRLPAGGYAHSGGLEAAIRLGLVSDLDDLLRFLIGRATTSGAVAAAFSAAACRACIDGDLVRLAELDTEFAARTPTPALRRVSLSLGRQLLRAWSSIRPHDLHDRLPQRLHHPVAFGATAAMLELAPIDAARGMLHETMMGPAMAVVKLMSVDPFHAHRVLCELLPLVHQVGTDAATFAEAPPEQLPAFSAPLTDILAEHHHAQRTRLFAS